MTEVLQIYTPDDSHKYYSTTISVAGMNMLWEPEHTYRSRYRWGRSNSIHPNQFRQHNEPTIEGIKTWLKSYLKWGTKGRPTFKGLFIIKKGMNEAQIHCMKMNTTYMIQGMVTTKETAITALARTVYRSCFTNDVKALETYCFNNILLPENVSYALENRAPYHWYKKGIKIDVRFNVSVIGSDECAIEISDGIWAPISVKKLNTYMNYYWKGQKSSSWYRARLTPKKLWKRLMGAEPTEAQLNMMIAFLEQNRTDTLVQERAYQLVKDMSIQYVDRMKVFWEDKMVKAVVVRGKLADWVITDNQYKSDIQAVSTYLFANSSNPDDAKYNPLKGVLKGPICIDNMTKNSSVGDQFAARAFALLNDKITIEIVSTIKHYMTDNHYEGQYDCRLDFDNISIKDIMDVVGESR